MQCSVVHCNAELHERFGLPLASSNEFSKKKVLLASASESALASLHICDCSEATKRDQLALACGLSGLAVLEKDTRDLRDLAKSPRKFRFAAIDVSTCSAYGKYPSGCVKANGVDPKLNWITSPLLKDAQG